MGVDVRTADYRPSPVVSGSLSDADIVRWSARSGGLNIAIAASKNMNMTATAVQPQLSLRVTRDMAISPPSPPLAARGVRPNE